MDANLVRTQRITATTPAIGVCVPKENELPSATLSSPPTRTITSTPWPRKHRCVNTPYRTSFGPRGLTSPLRSTFSARISLFACFSISALNIVSGSSQFCIISDNDLPTKHVPTSTPDPLQRAAEEPAHPKHNRRHSRMHSRNLFVFLPRAPYSPAQSPRIVQRVRVG